MGWTEDELQALPQKDGFRLRGLDMTRLETFTDAAFAFATTLLVISLTGIPTTHAELVLALKGTPAFAASFASIAIFWYAHRDWSRRFGLEDGPTTLISLGLVFIMLVYVYPLKMVFSALFDWISGGWFPSNITLLAGTDLPGLFVIYGIGFFALTACLAGLHLRALRVSKNLGLNERERVMTRGEILSFGVLATTGLVSALFAGIMPAKLGIWAGFTYSTLPITMPIVAIYNARKAARVSSRG